MKDMVSIKILRTEREALKALALKRGVFISKLLSKAIARYLGDQKDGAQ